MKFEVIKDNKTKFYTHDITCVPPIKQINTMLKCGYKFKLDNKAISKKDLDEMLKQRNEE